MAYGTERHIIVRGTDPLRLSYKSNLNLTFYEAIQGVSVHFSIWFSELRR